MQITKKHYFLSIANFRLELNFNMIEENETREVLLAYMKTYYKSALHMTKGKIQADYSIFFLADEQLNIIKNKSLSRRGSEYFIRIYSIKNQNAYVDYHIGIIQFHFLIKLIMQELLSNANGFVLHSSAVRSEKGVYLFLGQNGAGKSTIVRNLRKYYLPFADDMVIVRLINGVWTAFQMPMEKNNIPYKEGIGYPIVMNCFIKKSQKNALVKLSVIDVYKKFMKQLIGLKQNSSQLKYAFRFLADINENYELECQKNLSKEAVKNLLRS